MNLTVEKFKIGGVPIDIADKQSRENIINILQSVSALDDTVTAIDKSINNLQSDISGLNDITDSTQEDIELLQTSVSSLQKNITNLSNNVSTLQKNVSALETNVNNLSDTVSTLQSNVTALETNVNNLSDTVSTLQSNVTALETSKADNSDFETQYSSVTGSLIDGYVCNRKGNISLELGNKSLKSDLTANTWTTLLKLPTAYRPISQIYRTIFFSGSYPVILEIQVGGNVRAYSPTTLSKGVFCYDGTEFI